MLFRIFCCCGVNPLDGSDGGEPDEFSDGSIILRNFHISFLRIDLRLALAVMCFPYRNKKTHSPTLYSPNYKILRSGTTHNLFLWEGGAKRGYPPILSHPTNFEKFVHNFFAYRYGD